MPATRVEEIPEIEDRVLNVELFEQVINFAIDSYNIYARGSDGATVFLGDHGDVVVDNISWGQASWAEVLGDPSEVSLHECQSSFCIAGAAWYFSGLVEKFKEHVIDVDYCVTHEEYVSDGHFMSDEEGCRNLEYDQYNHKMINIDKVFGPDYSGPTESTEEDAWGPGAEILLGITTQEADDLFEGMNSIFVIDGIAKSIARARGVELNLTEIYVGA